MKYHWKYDDVDEQFFEACRSNDPDILQRFLTDYPELGANTLGVAAVNGYLHTVRHLLTHPFFHNTLDIHADDDQAFRVAAKYRQLEVVQYLLTSPELKKHSHVDAKNDQAFIYACKWKTFEIAEYLLRFYSPQRAQEILKRKNIRYPEIEKIIQAHLLRDRMMDDWGALKTETVDERKM